jgi:hypothetical protein
MPKTTGKYIICLIFLIAIGKAVSLSLWARGFEVVGIMEIKPTGHPTFSHLMQIFVQDRQWAVFRIIENVTNRTVVEISDDGTNIYNLTHLEPKAIGISPLESYSLSNCMAAGEIHPTGFPFRMLETESVSLFYAYASTYYLDTHTNQMIGSIILQPSDLHDGDKLSDVLLERTEAPLYLPREITFIDKAANWTNCILRCKDFTNIVGMQIPLEVSLERFYRDKTNILQTFTFHATKVYGECSLGSFTPSINSNGVFVCDYRFSHHGSYVPGIPQVVTNAWPTMAESKLKRGFAATQVKRSYSDKNPSEKTLRARFLIKSFLFIMLVAAIVGMCKIALKKK